MKAVAQIKADLQDSVTTPPTAITYKGPGGQPVQLVVPEIPTPGQAIAAIPDDTPVTTPVAVGIKLQGDGL